MTTPGLHRIRVRGHLDQSWSQWFGDLIITHEPNGETVMTGPVRDQAALFGLLIKVRDLGLTLISMNPIQPEQSD
jgi:hypothetical protein